MAANEYQTPSVAAPPVTGVTSHTPRERHHVDPDAKGHDNAVVKATDVPPSQAARKAEDSKSFGEGPSPGDGAAEFGPTTDPANLVQAQESGQPEADKAKALEQRRLSVASPSEMVGAPQDLARLDQNRDGRIDQLELQRAFRADGEDTTYAALTNYQKTLGFGEGAKPSVDPNGQKSEKLFAEEIAQAEAEKLSKGSQTQDDPGADPIASADSSSSTPKPDPQVKIVV